MVFIIIITWQNVRDQRKKFKKKKLLGTLDIEPGY
jgi:hypothetical protein